jgi:hypothetical protein
MTTSEGAIGASGIRVRPRLVAEKPGPQRDGRTGVAYLLVDQVRAIVPVSPAFAAGAMLTVAVVELIPDAVGGDRAPAR